MIEVYYTLMVAQCDVTMCALTLCCMFLCIQIYDVIYSSNPEAYDEDKAKDCEEDVRKTVLTAQEMRDKFAADPCESRCPFAKFPALATITVYCLARGSGRGSH